jgi:hypothetical protein
MNMSDNVTIENLPENSKLTTTVLIDSLGTVSFYIPVRFDTSFMWTNISDCGKACNHEQYRYQPRTLPIYKESDFYYEIPDIEIDQFSIIHSGYFPFHDGDTSKNMSRHENFISNLSSNSYNGTITYDTVEKIGDRYYHIVYMQGFDKVKQKYFAKVAALTTIKSNEIEFHYDIRKKDTINLIEFNNRAIRYIRTIHISNGI